MPTLRAPDGREMRALRLPIQKEALRGPLARAMKPGATHVVTIDWQNLGSIGPATRVEYDGEALEVLAVYDPFASVHADVVVPEHAAPASDTRDPLERKRLQEREAHRREQTLSHLSGQAQKFAKILVRPA